MCSFYVQLMLRIQISTFFANHSALSDKGLSLRSSLNEENECVFNKGIQQTESNFIKYWNLISFLL